MPRWLPALLTNIAALRITVILALLTGLLMSPKLWLSSRFYPLTPLWSFVRPFSFPTDYVFFFVLIALLITACVAPRKEILVGEGRSVRRFANPAIPRFAGWALVASLAVMFVTVILTNGLGAQSLSPIF